MSGGKIAGSARKHVKLRKLLVKELDMDINKTQALHDLQKALLSINPCYLI